AVSRSFPRDRPSAALSTLSLHDALPICAPGHSRGRRQLHRHQPAPRMAAGRAPRTRRHRSPHPTARRGSNGGAGMTPHPVDRPVRIDITWTELLRTPDRQLRRLLAARYRHAAQVERLTETVLAEIENGDAPPPARRAQRNPTLP